MAVAAPIAIGLSVAGMALSAYGSYQQGQAQQDAANYQAQVAKNNASLAQASAADAADRGKIEADQIRLRSRLMLGSQKAGFAARGVDLGSATVADVAQTQGIIGELDAQTTQNNSLREAQGFMTESNNYRSQAKLLKAQGKNDALAGKIGAGSTLLAGGSSVAGKWYNYNQGGAF